MSATSLHDKLSGSGALLTEYGGAETVAVFSSPETEFQALRTGCGVFDLPWRSKLAVGGKDRTRWLNGMVSNNIRDLAPGRGVYCFLLNPQGHILGDMYVYNRGESFLVDTDHVQLDRLRQLLQRYIIMDKVELSEPNPPLGALGLEGPQAQETLVRVGIEPSKLQPLEIEEGVCNGIKISLLRTLRGGFELWPEAEKTPEIWDALARAEATPVGSEAYELWRILGGVPRYGTDIRERDLPQETGQEQALSFTKGCYIGQEIVERIRSRGAVHRRFVGFRFSGAAPAAGTKITRDSREVGEITSVAALPYGEAVGLGYLRREGGATGATIDVGGVNSTVVDLPFRGL